MSTSRRLSRLLVVSVAVALGATLVPTASASASPDASSAPVEVQRAPLAAGTIAGLQQGARGDGVRQLQQALIDAGIPVGGGADGVFGPMTRSSVERFQAARGLPVTGRVDQATADALAGSGGGGTGATDGNETPPAPSTSSGAGYVGLSRGAQGTLVEDVQRALRSVGGVWLPRISGTFDAATERGVRQFQTWNRISVTGTVTQATASRLRLGSGSAPAADPAPAPAPTPEPPAADAGSEYVGLGQGSRGPRVAELQRALIGRGVNVVGGADGVYGPKTQQALDSFRRANGLSGAGAVSAADARALGLGGAAAPAPSPQPTPSRFVGLSTGARGDAVRQVQQALLDAGVRVPGGADGIFGAKTEAALRSYQSSQGLSATGSVDQATADRLGLGSDSGPQPFTPPAAAPAPGSPYAPYVGLKRGNSGPLVVELQQALQRTGMFLPGGADGSFGPATERVLKSFQSSNAIPQTGVVTERGARIMALGTNGQGAGSGGGNTSFRLERFPVQGRCFFGDTWHAPRGGGRLHVGTDVIANEGKLLYAVVDGEISRLYWDRPGALAGNGLRIAQPNGTYFTYLHMQGFAPGIELGTKVKAGDVIGWVGNTGSSATPHLHFEIHPGGGAAINPYPYLRAIDDCANTTPQYQSSFAPA